MEVRIFSIKSAREYLKDKNTENIKAIIMSSYDNDIDYISKNNKLILNFDDITTVSSQSFNTRFAKEINKFVTNINFEKYKLFVCCDSGESRSSAVAAAILRKYKQDEKLIWKDYTYRPNILVYKILCDEFELKNSKIRLRYLKHINDIALKTQINKSKQSRIFTLFKKIQRGYFLTDKS